MIEPPMQGDPSGRVDVLQTEVLGGRSLADCITSILDLDRANMEPILRAAGMEFPEARRLAILSDPDTTVVAARAGPALAGYVEFAPDERIPGGIYVSSVQVAVPYQRGPALSALLARMRIVLDRQPPSCIRFDVQRANASALALSRRLGCRIQETEPSAATLRGIAGPEVLDSPRLRRLTRRLLRVAHAAGRPDPRAW